MRSLCSHTVTSWATFSSKVMRASRSSMRRSTGCEASLYSGWAGACAHVVGALANAAVTAAARIRIPRTVTPNWLRAWSLIEGSSKAEMRLERRYGSANDRRRFWSRSTRSIALLAAAKYGFESGEDQQAQPAKPGHDHHRGR